MYCLCMYVVCTSYVSMYILVRYLWMSSNVYIALCTVLGSVYVCIFVFYAAYVCLYWLCMYYVCMYNHIPTAKCNSVSVLVLCASLHQTPRFSFCVQFNFYLIATLHIPTTTSTLYLPILYKSKSRHTRNSRKTKQTLNTAMYLILALKCTHSS